MSQKIGSMTHWTCILVIACGSIVCGVGGCALPGECYDINSGDTSCSAVSSSTENMSGTPTTANTVTEITSGTTAETDTEADSTTIETEGDICGNGVVDGPDEACDDGNLDANDACLPTCVPATCGDGHVWQGVEECDDGNEDWEDACLPNCVPAMCGDHHVWQGVEVCDDGANGDQNDGCTDSCNFPFCGDGYVQQAGGEKCDDGNMVDDDTCTNDCLPGLALMGPYGRISASNNSRTCALTQDGAVRCWGYGAWGALGYANTNNIGDGMNGSGVMPPENVKIGDEPAKQVIGSNSTTCALLTNGDVRCWGNGGNSGLGIGYVNIGDDEHPDSVPKLNLGDQAIQLADGSFYNCALLKAGVVRCWGYNTYGQLGYGHTDNIGIEESPGDVAAVDLGGAKATDMCAGASHTCAVLQGGAVKCWGYGAFGRLGYANEQNIGDEIADMPPPDVQVGGDVKQIACGGTFTCALLVDGTVKCWGENDRGTLGYGKTHAELEAVGDDEHPSEYGPVELGGIPVMIDAGHLATCALMEDASVRCWGADYYGVHGKGGYGSIGDDETPSAVSPVNLGGPVVEVNLGRTRTCARMFGGDVQCWGYGTLGGLGYGNELDIDMESQMPPGPVPFQ